MSSLKTWINFIISLNINLIVILINHKLLNYYKLIILISLI